MIADDDKMTAAVGILADDDGAARVHYQARKSENQVELIYHRLFLSFNSGTVPERKARAICSPEYQQAKEEEAKAHSALQRFRHNEKWADKITEIWRSEYSRTTAAERIR